MSSPLYVAVMFSVDPVVGEYGNVNVPLSLLTSSYVTSLMFNVMSLYVKVLSSSSFMFPDRTIVSPVFMSVLVAFI